MDSKPNNKIGYAIFGCQMYVYAGVMTIGFGRTDFSTGETSVLGGVIAGCAVALGVVGALVGWVVGSHVAQSPGARGKQVGFWLGLFIPLQAFFFVLVYAAVVSVALAIVSIFSPGVMGYQRGLILLGVWVVSILVSIFTVTGNGQESVDLRGGYGGCCAREDDNEVSSNTSGSTSSGIVYHTTSNLFGGTTTHGSDGTVYRTTESIFGGTTTHGSDGTVYRTTESIFGGTTTRGSDGTVYRTTESIFGGTTTRGSDGTVYRTTPNLFDDGTTTRSE